MKDKKKKKLLKKCYHAIHNVLHGEIHYAINPKRYGAAVEKEMNELREVFFELKEYIEKEKKNGKR